jgi:hypothetical protein
VNRELCELIGSSSVHTNHPWRAVRFNCSELSIFFNMLAIQPRISCKAQPVAKRAFPTRSHICSAALQRHGRGSSSAQQCSQEEQTQPQSIAAVSTFATSFGLYLLSAAPAVADVADAAGSTPFQGVTANSLYVTLALFLMTAPGEWAKVDQKRPSCTTLAVAREHVGRLNSGSGADAVGTLAHPCTPQAAATNTSHISLNPAQ